MTPQEEAEDKKTIIERMVPLVNEMDDIYFKLQNEIRKYPLTPDECFKKEVPNEEN